MPNKGLPEMKTCLGIRRTQKHAQTNAYAIAFASSSAKETRLRLRRTTGKEPKRTKKTRKRKRMGKEQSHPTRTFPSLLHSPTSAFSDAYILLSTSLTRGQHHIPVEPLTDCCALIRDAVLEYLSLSLLSLTWNKIAHKETTRAYNPLPEKKEVVRLRQQINQISPLTNTFLPPTHRIPTPQASYSSRSYQLS